MTLTKLFGLAVLAIFAATALLVIGYAFLLSDRLLRVENKSLTVSGLSDKDKPIKALPPMRIAGYLMPAKELKPDYATLTIRQLKKLAKGTGIRKWERLNKSQLVAALSG